MNIEEVIVNFMNWIKLFEDRVNRKFLAKTYRISGCTNYGIGIQ